MGQRVKQFAFWEYVGNFVRCSASEGQGNSVRMFLTHLNQFMFCRSVAPLVVATVQLSFGARTFCFRRIVSSCSSLFHFLSPFFFGRKPWELRSTTHYHSSREIFRNRINYGFFSASNCRFKLDNWWLLVPRWPNIFVLDHFRFFWGFVW